MYITCSTCGSESIASNNSNSNNSNSNSNDDDDGDGDGDADISKKRNNTSDQSRTVHKYRPHTRSIPKVHLTQ